MKQTDPAAIQADIAAEMHVTAEFDANAEIERRVSFLANYLRSNDLKAYVLGISGGIDSTTAGRLAQLAVERLRAASYDARFVAIRLPHGEQKDEADAQQALAFIRADETVTVDIKPAADAMLASLHQSGLPFADEAQEDFVHGNIKARQRMIAQYAIASTRMGVVIGTDHAAESLMGFFYEVRRRRRRCPTARRTQQAAGACGRESTGRLRRARSQGADRGPRSVAPATARRRRLRRSIRNDRRLPGRKIRKR